ncbi:hypothetical protein EV421DRAFT_1922541 [Armillaria borealis]|uniref:BRCT domain-containing protein n=1 Tax=Armillaria borealis TaxID=47425 RepID=A0AA39KDG5_9AGAR|nr:hypothetical protein EV421DRAFT_1922541 [Armillaria borealis]
MSVESLPSQQLDDSVSSLFVDTGAIFVDPGAGGIIGRPKLLRSLRKLGASLCHDPRSAKYILVHPQSDTGRQFIRDWGTDAGKIVLNHLWVQKCSAAGRVLGADDNWGNCTTHDDGLPIGSTEEEDVKSPLPTPRETPVDARPSTSNSSSAKRAPSKTPVPSQPQPPASHATSPVVSDSQTSTSIVPPVPSDSSPNVPQVHQNAMPLPAASAGSAAPSAPFFPPHMMPPDMMQQFFQQMMMNHMYQSNMMQHSMPDPRHPLYGPLVDSYSNHLGQISQTQPPNNVAHPLHSPASQYEDQQPDTSNPPYQMDSRPGNLAHQTELNHLPHARLPFLLLGHPKHLSLPPLHLRIYLPNPETGESLNFFVEVNMGFSTQRSVTTSQIKKHGGKLAHQKERADYCILSQKCKTFDTDLSEAVYYDVPAISSSFVTDCVKAKRLLDHSDYLFDIPAKLQNKRKSHQKRKQSNARETVKRVEGSTSTSPSKRMSPERNDTPWKRRKIENDSHSRPTPKPTTWDSNLRSPSPPPEHTRIMFSEGRYRYTLQEREYLRSYSEVLLKRDIDITNTAIAERIFAKMPHHSLKSWNQQIQKAEGFRLDIEAIRKRVGIAQRLKRNQAPAVERSMEVPPPATPSPPPPPAETPLIESGPSQRDPFEEDLNAVVDFFALDGADEDEDEPDAIWAKLTSKVKCQTAASWSDFHCQHHVEIQRRYELLAESNNDGA